VRVGVVGEWMGVMKMKLENNQASLEASDNKYNNKFPDKAN